jgi:O-acetyl-ADP-ribose deacetylase (regulator of RNase III)
MAVKIVNGDLLSCDAEYIVQQCNTTSKKCLGLSSLIAKKWPTCNFYRETREPGSVVIKERVIGLMSQVNPGKPKGDETKKSRELLFLKCLDQLPPAKSIAFPFGIGCGLAGGDWTRYFKLIKHWAKNNPKTKVFVYKLGEEEVDPKLVEVCNQLEVDSSGTEKEVVDRLSEFCDQCETPTSIEKAKKVFGIPDFSEMNQKDSEIRTSLKPVKFNKCDFEPEIYDMPIQMSKMTSFN